MLRLCLLVALCVAAPVALTAGEDQFNGAWIAWLCPAGVQNDPVKCSTLVLELHQKQDRICGAHVFATAGATQLDEGPAPSIAGSVFNGIAIVSVESGRVTPPLKVQVEVKAMRGGLQWRRLDNPEGDYLLPLSARLSKSRHGSLFHPVFGQKLGAGCAAILNMPTGSATSAAAPEPR
jgi:hypothetical protein